MNDGSVAQSVPHTANRVMAAMMMVTTPSPLTPLPPGERGTKTHASGTNVIADALHTTANPAATPGTSTRFHHGPPCPAAKWYTAASTPAVSAMSVVARLAWASRFGSHASSAVAHRPAVGPPHRF